MLQGSLGQCILSTHLTRQVGSLPLAKNAKHSSSYYSYGIYHAHAVTRLRSKYKQPRVRSCDRVYHVSGALYALNITSYYNIALSRAPIFVAFGVP